MQMKKTLRNIFLVSALSPLLIQCASQDEVQRLQYQLHVVNKKLEEMKSTTVGDIQKRQAASSNQIDQLDREILNLKGQLEETNHLNRRLKEQNKELETNITVIAQEEATRREEALQKIQDEQRLKEARIADLNEKLRIQQESLQAIQQARVRDAERRAKEAKLKAEAARAKALAASKSVDTSSKGIIRITADRLKRKISSAPAPLPSSAVTSTSKPVKAQPATGVKPAISSQQQTGPKATVNASESPFSKAEKLYNQKDYKQAYSAFESIAATNPSSDQGISAGFMMGECLYEQKEYDKAILQYQKIISQNGTHAKAASATYRQAMAFEQLADNETARMIYKKILNHYGSSPEATKAKEKLGNM